MASIEFVTIEVAGTTAANRFYTAAFWLGTHMRLRDSTTPTVGFRGFTLSLIVSQPATVNGLIGAALGAGVIWTLASSSKKDTGPATRQIDDIVLQLGVTDVAASRQFQVDRGFAVAKSCGGRYVEFGTGPAKLTLYKRRDIAKVAGVPADGTGSHPATPSDQPAPLATAQSAAGRRGQHPPAEGSAPYARQQHLLPFG